MVGQREFMDVHDAWVRGKSISEIARQTGRDRKTIRRLLREGAQAGRKPRQISSKLDPFREYLLGRMVGEDPVSNAEVLYDEIHELGYRGGRSILKEFMHPFRAVAKEKATVRFETPPGHQAQVDWGHLQEAGSQARAGFRHDAGLVAHAVPRLHRQPGLGSLPGLSRASLSRLRWCARGDSL